MILISDRPLIIKTIVNDAETFIKAEEYSGHDTNISEGLNYYSQPINISEENYRLDNYISDFKQSNGILPEIFVRKKNTVSIPLLICEMILFYKKNEMTLSEDIEKLYEKYGYWNHKIISLSFNGIDGMERMLNVLNHFRKGCFTVYTGSPIIKPDKNDYADFSTIYRSAFRKDSFYLSKSDVVLFSLEKNCEVLIRPSGTEPKMKYHLTVKSKDKYSSIQMLKALENDLVSKIRLFLEY